MTGTAPVARPARADPERAWHPVAATHDLPPRHVFHGQLLGRELAIWRADDGHVNVWRNRCLHRGVRLSIGINDGRELKCQYHGWRYANRTGGCTYIPAHPADAPARTMCCTVFPSVERYGLVWSGTAPEGEVPDHPEFGGPASLVLRGIPVDAPPELVLERLAGYRFRPSGRLGAGDADVAATPVTRHALRLESAAGGAATALLLVVQPVDSRRSAIRGVVDDAGGDRIGVLRHHNRLLSEFRDAVEREAAEFPAPGPEEPDADPLPSGRGRPETRRGRSAPLRVRIAEKRRVADEVCGFRLAPVSGALPAWQPGAHVDVHLPNGLVRQYSLVGAPGDGADYVIGVKLEPESAGGSKWLHESAREGDELAVSGPHNGFPLRRDAARTLLIAGGIGVTPLLSMARTLDHSGLRWELHYLVRDRAQAAFPELLSGLGDAVRLHPRLAPGEAAALLDRLLADREERAHVYLCGPAPMLDAARSAAERRGWPDEAVHFEYFGNPNPIDDSSAFDVELARSCLTLRVPAGKSILEVLRENGIDVASSCEQGACGTCAVPVIAGEIDHQDVCLGNAEKASGGRIMTCVSRAAADRLVLDI